MEAFLNPQPEDAPCNGDKERSNMAILSNYLLTYFTPWCRILFETLSDRIKKYPALFMEPEGSSPCSQNPAT
jgi:hypothetical protein